MFKRIASFFSTEAVASEDVADQTPAQVSFRAELESLFTAEANVPDFASIALRTRARKMARTNHFVFKPEAIRLAA